MGAICTCAWQAVAGPWSCKEQLTCGSPVSFPRLQCRLLLYITSDLPASSERSHLHLCLCREVGSTSVLPEGNLLSKLGGVSPLNHTPSRQDILEDPMYHAAASMCSS